MRPEPTVWTVAVPELDRAVDVPVYGDRSATVGELLAALDFHIIRRTERSTPATSSVR